MYSRHIILIVCGQLLNDCVFGLGFNSIFKLQAVSLSLQRILLCLHSMEMDSDTCYGGQQNKFDWLLGNR